METMTKIITVCTAVVAVGGAAMYLKKIANIIRHPLEEMNRKIEKNEKESEKHDEYFKNDLNRLDKHDKMLEGIKEDNRIVMRSLFLLLKHAETGNNTGEIAAGRKELEEYLTSK